MLPYDKLRNARCIACANRNIDAPALLIDPDHMHSCTLQQGVSVRQRHDAIKLTYAELARSCGYHVEIEPAFPATVSFVHQTATDDESNSDDAMEHTSTPHAQQSLARGDLLLTRHNNVILIDVTVVRPTSLTNLVHHSRGSIDGPHMHPLFAAHDAEKHKHKTYDAECAKHGWKFVACAMESYGAKGDEAVQLLEEMSAHCINRSPSDFLAHADRMLSVALQTGNARISAYGTAAMHMHAQRHSGDLYATHSAGRRSTRQHARALRNVDPKHASHSNNSRTIDSELCNIVHAQYHSARVGVTARVASCA